MYKLFLKKVVKAQYDVLSSYGTTESVFIDIIQNANSIRYFNKQALFNDIIQQSYEFYQSKLVNLGFRGNHLTLIVELINSIVICGVLFSASVLNLQSQLSSGELVSIFQLTMIILSSLGQIVLFNVNIQEAKVAFERMQEYINLSPEVIVDEKNQLTITDFVNLKIKELSFSFPGQLPLLEEANLEINRGEIVVLLGSTGSSKSTLLQIIQKALPFDFGEILVNGKNIDLISTILWRDYIGFVEQETGIFSGTIMNNITMGEFNADISSFQEFMKELELHVFFEEFPHGYDTVIGKDGIILSGGQKQLVGLARALWKKPQLLLLDEPTSSLDEDTESIVVRLLKRVKPNISILLLTHKRSLCIIANRTYLLHDRKIRQITAV